MRIIAGTLKGRRLETPDWPGLRPTSDKLRETLFNVIAGRVEGARVLDAYAGTGAVGLEALSRGAAHVTFVERDGRAARLIARNLERTGIGEDRHAIIRADLAAVADGIAGQPFDIVFLDPPYGAAELARALDAVAPAVAGATLVVVEHATRDPAPERSGRLRRVRQLSSGDSALTFFRVPAADAGTD